MRVQYGNILVGLEEVFFYNPNKQKINLCSMCDRIDCPVPDKTIVSNCNSYITPPRVTDADTIKEEFRIMAGMEVVSTLNYACIMHSTS